MLTDLGYKTGRLVLTGLRGVAEPVAVGRGVGSCVVGGGMTVAVGGAVVVEAGGVRFAAVVRVGERTSGSAVADPVFVRGREACCEELGDDILKLLPELGYKRTSHR